MLVMVVLGGVRYVTCSKGGFLEIFHEYKLAQKLELYNDLFVFFTREYWRVATNLTGYYRVIDSVYRVADRVLPKLDPVTKRVDSSQH